jgi:hypothetical protein
VGPDLGEEFEVRLEKGKTLQVKLLTPGLSVSAALCRLCLTNKFHYRNCFVFSCQKARILALTDNAMQCYFYVVNLGSVVLCRMRMIIVLDLVECNNKEGPGTINISSREEDPEPWTYL